MRLRNDGRRALPPPTLPAWCGFVAVLSMLKAKHKVYGSVSLGEGTGFRVLASPYLLLAVQGMWWNTY